MSIMEDSVVINFFRGWYESIATEFRSFDTDFFRGLAFIVIWIFIVGIPLAFIGSMFLYIQARWVGLGIVIFILLIESVSALGRHIGKK